MGFREITLKLPTDYTDDDIKANISRELDIKQFSFQVNNKSLDARKKNNIHWLLRIGILSEEIQGGVPEKVQSFEIPCMKRKETAVVVGSGPAGFFSAYVLQKAGFSTTIIERGTDVNNRAAGIMQFEKTGTFSPISNYAFGEGGAGTFSDGKLTSRSKHISKERQFILSSYIEAGAPEEIGYMAHPHLGTDNLRKIVRNLRESFLLAGGTILFETMLHDLTIKSGKVIEAATSSGTIPADYFIIAPGHSAFETYRMLMRRGIGFLTKHFALGSRVEHSQQLINEAQWGRETLPGIKAAEYRLTSEGDGKLPVYTFCMCPGGIVVPSTAYEHSNIVNGMSRYRRDGRFANAACVAGVHPDRLIGREASPIQVLDWLEGLEQSFYQFSDGFQAPFCQIRDFIDRKERPVKSESSYPLGLISAPLWDLLPSAVSNAIREGLKDFSRKIKGFDTGIIMGLESKTSSPVRVIRENDGRCAGFENLYIVGEGSGCSGGIISSAADGIKAAVHIIEKT
jgi:uncharacterized protein